MLGEYTFQIRERIKRRTKPDSWRAVSTALFPTSPISKFKFFRSERRTAKRTSRICCTATCMSAALFQTLLERFPNTICLYRSEQRTARRTKHRRCTARTAMSAALFLTWLEPVLCPATRTDPSSGGTSPKTALLSHKVYHVHDLFAK